MEEESPNRWNRFKKVLSDNLLTILLLTSVITSCGIGVIIRSTTESIEDPYAQYIGFPGNILIRILKCSATPLIITCIVVALGHLDLKVSGRICWQLIVLVFGTKAISSMVGLTSVLLIRPGISRSYSGTGFEWEKQHGTIMDVFLDMFRNVFTANMIRMYIQQMQTKLITPEGNDTDPDPNTLEAEVTYINSLNMLGLIFIAIMVGLCLALLESEGKALYNLSETVYGVSMKVATWILWLCPGFIFFLIVAEILKIEDFFAFAKTWGMFLLTTHAGFVFILLVEYPLLVFLLARENPFKLFMDVGGALVTAYATASSMATMPLVIEGLLKSGLDPRLVRFVVPIAININKDGAANFLVVTTVFVAQMFDVSLTWGHYFSILVLGAMGSIAAASVPFSAIVVLVMVLNGLGLSQNLVGGILAVEWINDRAATLCNIWGNCCQTKILSKWNRKQLEIDDTKT